jgi:hypothetical protein
MSGRVVGVPLEIPAWFVKRPEASEPVRKALRGGADGATTAVISAVHGLGGVGKTTLAAALVDESARDGAFPDGIFWLTLGEEMTESLLLTSLAALVRFFGDREYQAKELEPTSAHLRGLLRDKQTLIVVDDAWKTEHVRPFRVVGPKGRLLITTRDALIARDANATLFDLDSMSPEEARALIEGRLGRALEPNEELTAAALAEELGRLPLALELAAAQVADGVPLGELLDDLKQEIAHLEILEPPGADEQAETTRKRLSVRSSFRSSLRRLSPERRERFAWLGILREDTPMAPEMVTTLWGTSVREARDTLRYLRDKALLMRGVPCADGSLTYRLHDLMRNEALRLVTAPVDLEGDRSLPGLGLSLTEAHAEFLALYRMRMPRPLRGETLDLRWRNRLAEISSFCCDLMTGWLRSSRFGRRLRQIRRGTPEGSSSRPISTPATPGLVDRTRMNAPSCRGPLFTTSPSPSWHAVADDGYLYDHLTWHLEQAGRSEEIHELLWAEDAAGKNGWYEARERLGQTSGYLADIERAWELADKDFVHDPSPSTMIRQARYALIRSSLNSLAGQLWDELLKLLVDHGLWTVEAALTYVRCIPGAFQGVQAKVALLPRLAPGVRPSVVREALEAARAITDESYRASALAALAPHLDESERRWVVREALEAARGIGDESDRAIVLAALVPHLDEATRRSVVSEALEVARGIWDGSARATALVALAPHLDEATRRSVVSEVVEVARGARFESARATALAALAPHVDEATRRLVVSEALKAAQHILENSPDGGGALYVAELAPHLDEATRRSVVSEALEAARYTLTGSVEVMGLAALAPQVDESERRSVVREALEAARGIEDGSARATALAALALHLDEAERRWVVREAVAAARGIKEESERAKTLTALVPDLDEATRREAVEAAQCFSYSFYSGAVLSALAPHLDAATRRAALEGVRHVGGPDRARALSALAPHLDEAERRSIVCEALAASRHHWSESRLASVLAALAPPLDAETGREALEAARRAEDPSDRATALAALVPHLEESVRPSVVREALEAARSCLEEKKHETILDVLAADKKEGVRALIALAPLLDEATRRSVVREALEAARGIEDQLDRAEALVELAPRLDAATRRAALEATWGFRHEWYRAQTLAALASNLDEATRHVALEMARGLRDEWCRAHALAALTPHLDAATRRLALATARGIRHESARARALSALAPHLDEAERRSVVSEAVEAARGIRKPSDRAPALAALTLFLQDDEKRTVSILLRRDLATWLQQGSRDTRARLIDGLVHMLEAIPIAGGPETMCGLARAIVAVGKWWP